MDKKKKTAVDLDPATLAKIKKIQLKAKHLVNSSFAGEYQSAFKGRGMTFDEIREYQAGDDIRSIDWNVTARTGDPYVKVFKDERELQVILIVDVSASSYFGSVDKLKNEVAAEIAALLAYTALKNNDKVGLIVFSEEVEKFIPPKRGRGHIWALIREILSHETQGRTTNFEAPLEFLNQVVKHKAIVFFLSDFIGDFYEMPLRVTAKRHDVIAIKVSDPREVYLPSLGYLEVEDAESGEMILVDTSSKRFTDSFYKKTTEELSKEREFFYSSGIDLMRIETHRPYIQTIIQFFYQRNKSRRRK